MMEATTKFFDSIAQCGYDPRLSRMTGVARFDLNEGDRTDHWFLAVCNGQLRVSRDVEQEPDAVFTADAKLFDRIAAGEENPVAAMLRGAATIRGNLRLLVQLERLFPGPPNARGPRCLHDGKREQKQR
ncbi:MAG TPA: SCP2 sterol-binding domain-containing protein [Micromonosporaceae bacterium]|nr:SCP2 sterol-binding domain-containing protein [Micromonosporaceae bacterium]